MMHERRAATTTNSDSGRRSAALRSALAGLLGATLYGSWAFFVNDEHGAGVALTAALTQAFVSFSITSAITAMMEGFSGLLRSRVTGFLVSSIGGFGIAAFYTLGMHAWMGTPEILKTAAPSLLVGSVYCCIYSAALARAKATAETTLREFPSEA